MASSSTLSMLPLDLIREILLRILAESLVGAKLTCKNWCDIIDDNLNLNYKYKKTFIYEHLDRSPIGFLRVDKTVQVMDLVNRTRSDLPTPDDFYFMSDMRYLVHCDGLMLCSWNNRSLALWNPLTRKINWVEPSPTYHDHFMPVSYEDYFGIGYDNNKHVRDYKILKFRAEKKYSVEIYECNSKSWKILEVAKAYRHVFRECIGVSVNGNMYWIALEKDKRYWDALKQKRRPYILGFDFSLEKFKDICFCPSSPPLQHYDYSPYHAYLSSYNGDSLSLLEQEFNSRSIAVWVSSKLADGNVLFVKHFSVHYSPDLPVLRSTFDPCPVYCIADNKRIIAWSRARNGVSLFIHEIDMNGVIHIHTRETKRAYEDSVHQYCGYIYVPSLVPLP